MTAFISREHWSEKKFIVPWPSHLIRGFQDKATAAEQASFASHVRYPKHRVKELHAWSLFLIQRAEPFLGSTIASSGYSQ